MSQHRTYGQTGNCAGCRYWSEMVATAEGGGPVKALCLSRDGPAKGHYQPGNAYCSKWASGHLGAIDEPGQDPRAYEGATA